MPTPKPCPFCGTKDIEPTRWDLDILEDPVTGVEHYDIRMVMNCPNCGVSLVGPDAIAETVDEADVRAADLVIEQWNKRFHETVNTNEIDHRTLLISDKARRGVANHLLEFCGRSKDTDLHELLTIALFGPEIKINGNDPILNKLVDLINRPICIVTTAETEDGSLVTTCSNCGEPISHDASFCPHCSAEVIGYE